MDVILHAGHNGHSAKWFSLSPSGDESEPIIFEANYSVAAGFKKPLSIIRNAKIDGFRKPSSYAVVPFIKFHNDNRAVRNFVEYRFNGGTLTRWDRRGWPMRRDEISGGGNIETNVSFGAGPAPANVNEVRVKLLNNIKDERFDAAMVIGEMSGTVKTVNQNLLRIGRSLAALKKGNPKAFYYLLTGKTRDRRRPTDKFLRETMGAFLEWKYGVMPSVLDLQGALSTLDAMKDGSLWDSPPLLVARSRRVTTATDTVYLPIRVGYNVLDGMATIKRTYEYSARCDYKIKPGITHDLNRYGIGLGSIATLVWDKHPFTFVLDMVIPIADIIKAWTALDGTEVIGYCETLFEKTEVIATSGRATSILTPDTLAYDVVPYKIFSFKRTAFASPPMPLPFVKNPISTGNLATVLALFTTLRKPS